MKRQREVLLSHGWQESPIVEGWYWVAGPGRVIRPAYVRRREAGDWWVDGAGGGGLLRGRLVFPCELPPGVRFPKGA